MIPGGVKLTSSTWAHYTSSLVIFIPEKFRVKWEIESLKNRKKGVSESQPMTNTLGSFMYSTYGAHTCKYLVNWRNCTKRDLNLKWQNWGSFDILKLIFAFTVRKGQLCFDWYLLLPSHFSRVRLCATSEMAAHQAPPSLGFSRQEYWSGLPFPSPVHESEK